MNIELHIERLVLEGIDIPPGRGEQLRAGISAELARLLRDGGLADSVTQPGAVARLSGAPAELSASGPDHLARQLAGSVYAGIGR